jgi:type II secretory pathway pseudopilin PulG
MIELIFVIVILGILAAVALPKFASVQDDALVSSEKAGIGSARSGVLALSGKFLTNAQKADINISTTLSSDGQPVKVIVSRGFSTTIGTGAGDSVFPRRLSFSSTATGTGTNRYASLLANATKIAPGVAGEPLGIVLEEGRGQYSEGALTAGTAASLGSKIKIIGPASSSITDDTAELNKLGSWEYNNYTGLIRWNASSAY